MDLTLKTVQKLVEANKNAKRSMAEFGRNQEDPHRSTNRMNNFQKGKSFNKQGAGLPPRMEHLPLEALNRLTTTTMGGKRSGRQPGTGGSQEEHKDMCQNQGNFKSVCRSAASLNVTDDISDNKSGLMALGMVPGYSNSDVGSGSPKVTRRGNIPAHKFQLQPNQAAIPHMKSVKGKWQETRPDRHPKIVVGATLCLQGSCAIGQVAPNQFATVWGSTQIVAIPDTGAMTSVLGRSVANEMMVRRHELIPITKKLVAANGLLIPIDGAMILTLSLGDA